MTRAEFIAKELYLEKQYNDYDRHSYIEFERLKVESPSNYAHYVDRATTILEFLDQGMDRNLNKFDN